MDQRAFIGTLTGGLIAAPLVTEAQWAEKVWRVGFLNEGFGSRFDRMLGAIRLGLQEHGYIEGRNMTVDYRWADGQYDRLPSLAAELVRLNPDALITSGTPCTLALKQATSTIPIVMAAIGNAVEAGAVASLARPGGNITGSTFRKRAGTPRIPLRQTGPTVRAAGHRSCRGQLPRYRSSLRCTARRGLDSRRAPTGLCQICDQLGIIPDHSGTFQRMRRSGAGLATASTYAHLRRPRPRSENPVLVSPIAP
jgi:hypothetical protein